MNPKATITEPEKTVTWLLEDHLSAKPDLAAATVELTKRATYLFIEAFGNLPIRQITARIGEGYRTELLSRFGSGATVGIYIRSLRPLFTRAVRLRYIKDQPLSGGKVHQPTDQAMRIYTQAELQAMLAAAEEPLWKAVILCGSTAGLRRAELLNLRTCDVDTESARIIVQARGATAEHWAWKPKGRRSRTVTLVPELADLFAELQRTNPKHQPYLLLPASRYFLLQQMRRQGQWTERLGVCPFSTIDYHFQTIREAAHVPYGTLHDLRRTCLTTLAEASFPVHWLREFAGHADLKTTEMYYLGIRRREMLGRAQEILSA